MAVYAVREDTMQKQFKLTKERLEELRQELEHLKTVREKEVAELIKEARSFGDLSENSEYDEAKNEQGKLYSRIAELENVLSNYVVISEDEISTQEVSAGVRVKVQCLEDGSVEEYQIVGSQEANPGMSRISDESPFGRAIIGKRIGEIAVVEAPAGNVEYKILEISK